MSELLPFAHSGITAEGDNSVLCQKVTKELLLMLQKGQVQRTKATRAAAEIAKEKSPLSVETQIDLLRHRENVLIDELESTTATKVGEGKSIYQIWMREDNELVQNVAKSFGERVVAEMALERITKHATSAGVRELFTLYLQLHLNSLVLKDLGWYIVNDLVSIPAGKALNHNQKVLVEKIHRYALSTVNSFGIPEHLLTAPIAQDYAQFNAKPNNGETHHAPKL